MHRLKDVHGATPLHYACRFNQKPEIVRILLNRAAADNLSTFNKAPELKPTDEELQNSEKVREYINIPNGNNQSAYTVAANQHHNEIVDFLTKCCGTKSASESSQPNLQDFEKIREAIYMCDNKQLTKLLRSWSHTKGNGIIQGPHGRNTFACCLYLWSR